MSQLRSYLGSYKITPIGIVLLLVLAAGCVLGAVGDAQTQEVGLVLVGIVLALILSSSGVRLGRGRGGLKTLAERRAEFHPTDRRDVEAAPISAQAEDELWAKERERYRQSSSQR
jgi:hypothetical protein